MDVINIKEELNKVYGMNRMTESEFSGELSILFAMLRELIVDKYANENNPQEQEDLIRIVGMKENAMLHFLNRKIYGQEKTSRMTVTDFILTLDKLIDHDKETMQRNIKSSYYDEPIKRLDDLNRVTNTIEEIRHNMHDFIDKRLK
ncbi:hypothetical protein [Bacillus sp. WC2502]|uniref:hypothetical protein n=1 Tax=Bacillus sp. WC2502 TaxID=3461401 RepID=UPI0040451365